MDLQAQVPGIHPQHQTGQFLVGKDRNAVTVFAIGFARLLGNDILPAVQEIRAARTIGYDHVRFVGFHRLKLLVGVRNAVAPVGFYQILPETETAAVPPLRIINHLPAP